MTNEQIKQSAGLIDNAVSSINTNRNAHLAIAKALNDLKEKAEKANALQVELEAAKKQITFNEATIASLNGQLTKQRKPAK